MSERASTLPPPPDDLTPPPEARTAPIVMLVAAIVLIVNVLSFVNVGPDDDLLRDLRRSTARVAATSVSCSQGGRGPQATIVVNGRFFSCGGVECGPGAAPAITMVRYDPRNPSRCRAEDRLEGASTWEASVGSRAIFGVVVALVFVAASATQTLRQRAARRDFYASKTWQDYVAQRDG